MLLELSIKNFAIIEDLKVEFEKGLNIITGETGSGKSIIIDALSIVLGARTNKEIIKKNKDFAYIEAIFTNYDDNVREEFLKNNIEISDLIVISKEIRDNRPSITKINGRTVTSSVLNTITSKIIDIFAQHENTSLMNSKNQRDLIDSLCGKGHIDKLFILKEKVEKIHKLKDSYLQKISENKDIDREMDLLKYQIDEIKDANLKDEDEENLDLEYRKLNNLSKINLELNSTISILKSNYEGANIVDLIDNVISSLSSVKDYDKDINTILDEFENIRYTIKDQIYAIEEYVNNSYLDEERFNFLENRINTINDLKRKYGNTISEIFKYLKEIEERYAFLEDYDRNIEKLKSEIEELENEGLEISKEISSRRKEVSRELEISIKNELKELNIESAKFKVDFKDKELSADGIDKIEFLISTNLGEDFKSLSKTASGGEMSRIMLGFKSIIAQKDNIATLIFDEIDTGISGRTAATVGKKIKNLSKERQIIAISHLPQIVSLSDEHYLIEKKEEDGNTTSNIRKLSKNEREEELARLLGGLNITKTSLEAAREMLKKGEE